LDFINQDTFKIEVAMTHHMMKSGYAALTDRINLYPQGAPPLSEQLFKFLSVLYLLEFKGLLKLPGVFL
jgi:hypothetical protein